MSSYLPDAVPLGEIRCALVTKLRHHGDVLLASPVFSTLKRAAPHVEIDALVYAGTAAMLANHPSIPAIHTIDRDWKRQGPGAQLAGCTGAHQAAALPPRDGLPADPGDSALSRRLRRDVPSAGRDADRHGSAHQRGARAGVGCPARTLRVLPSRTADGRGPTKGKIFRIGHMGYVADFDVTTALAALEQVLHDLGQPVDFGASLGAAQKVFAERG
jgi:hypothetical protein